MKIALISDIHANYEALRLWDDVLRDADQIVCLGDVTGYYCQVNEVIDALRGYDVLCILGNHDYFVLHGCPPNANPAVRFGVDVADRMITPQNRAWLASLPAIWGGYFGGKLALLAHGSPWNPIADYLYADHPRLVALDDFACDLVAFGQTHRMLLHADAAPVRVNPGSIGQPRDEMARSSLVIWDTERMTYQPLRRSFDPDPVIRLARQQGAGDWINKHLIAE